ncbi:adenine-specific DNA-methyltransferase [Evansella vedderi]|uniref:Adenine-specific DNA-methyltransferase n=1 Tax=Evansella vedderi TaxID=38282 RepID=A0ABT9ZWP1_9BACI|nr:site-specific DNA-methyltransferase [Evansella vedderi]MDQ0255646.1 adenine-specific DNA-methyltransferase [Evansella vedderi]
MPILNFKGKSFVQNHHFGVKYHQLVPHQGKSLTDKVNLYDNLVVHGDNLKALKALLPTYAGKVKCIYIDPPYNTGNEQWIYNDNVNSPMMREWLGNVVDKEDLNRHDKWLCMMMPRLKLLRELLSEDGVIFVSIDDDEQHHLRMLMDEVFGSNNFITNIIWQKKFSPQNDAKYFSDMHDFIICYAKNRNDGDINHGWIRNLLPRSEEMNSRYKNPDNDPRGPWTSGDLSVKTYSEEYDYPIETPSGRIVHPPKGSCWRVSKEKLNTLIKDNRIWFGKEGKSVPRLKRFLSEVQGGLVPGTVWLNQEVGHNQQAKQYLNQILHDKESFNTPKPVSLIKRIIQIASNEDSIILDSFAGSGSTAHAVLEQNKEDNGNRKFILVEMEDYADELTAERVRRVIQGVPTAKDDGLRKGLGGTFSYFTLGAPIEMEAILHGKSLPSYEDLARYVFFTSTGEEFDPSNIDQDQNFIGESSQYEVYLFYRPDMEYLKSTSLNLETAKQLGELNGKKRLVFAPMKYLDQEYLHEYKIEFSQLPFEIYRMKD